MFCAYPWEILGQAGIGSLEKSEFKDYAVSATKNVMLTGSTSILVGLAHPTEFENY
jgi:hypothetical protein